MIGPLDIPKGHKLYGKKGIYRWGYYTRTLVLWSGVKIRVRVQRYYDPIARRSYSLLPFYIMRYQRHIITIIQDILEKRIINGLSYRQIETNKPPFKKTIKRWTKLVLAALDQLRKGIAKHLIQKGAEYFAVDTAKKTLKEKFEDLLSKAKELANEEEILQYGALSYILHALQVNIT